MGLIKTGTGSIFTGDPNYECGHCGHKIHLAKNHSVKTRIIQCSRCGNILSGDKLIEL